MLTLSFFESFDTLSILPSEENSVGLRISKSLLVRKGTIPTMSDAARKGAVVNVLNFRHPHLESLFKEGLWGFPDDRRGLNRARWSAMDVGVPMLFYGDYDGTKGIFLRATLTRKAESREPVKYWIQNQTGYPLHIYLRLESETDLKNVRPIKKEELALTIPVFRQRADRWSSMVFGEKGKGVTYPFDKFSAMLSEFEVRNRRIVMEKPEHESLKEILYQMGIIQKRVCEKEVKLDGYKIDVAWKKIPKGYPYIVFEVHLSGNLEETLTKLKHAYDVWNSQPLVLVTTGNQIEEAHNIINGSFHEVRDKFRLIDWRDIKQAYDAKSKYKELEARLGIF